ncbi:unnamed protein product [Candidula unifasciata]|uniref:Prostaglandin E synthase 2 n=1 Tax=Candidula unifasciata TaxID=100452 RepID=A0A8S4A537_9EUPU|nr:unnamed protein product [Candidula unifasciata]
MAAPLKRRLTVGVLTQTYTRFFPSTGGKSSLNLLKSQTLRHFSQKQRPPPHSWPKIRYVAWVGGGVAVATTAVFLGNKVLRQNQACTVFAETRQERPYFKPSREVRVDTDTSGLKLTLYQFQTCPFCCKVRAVLDYHGFSYDVIEVNSVTKKQIKWTDYPKVPILVVETAGAQPDLVIKDSSVIISVLESYLHDRNTSLAKYLSYYPCLTENEGRKKKYDFANKYFIMFQETTNLPTTPESRNEERKWRKWADEHLVHMLSPNAYRTVKEALQAFHYFSDVGQWEQNFSFVERQVVIYVGAAVMYIMGMILKAKYNLKDDVRQSLYDACNEWLAAVGKDRPFMGGNQPNLADLAVYGVLNSIEGCYAFQDALTNTNIGPWYNRTKKAVQNHSGADPHNIKSLPSNIPKLSDKH